MENDMTYLLNIQQQVRKNQIEIELLKSGIKIVGAGETLPTSANEGDCYLLGTDNDYGLNAYVNGNWIPLGSFPAVGPQGVPGVKGDPAVISYITCAARAIDYGLAPHVSASVNGETVSFDFELPRGPMGLQGKKGEKGDKGDQGNVGPQGPQGEPGNSIQLFQNPSVVTASDLPAASVVGAGVGYLVGTLQDGYELYVTANDPLEWVDAGPFIPSQIVVDTELDMLSDNAIQNKPVAKAIGMTGTFFVMAAMEQGLNLTTFIDDILTNGYPFSSVGDGNRYKYIAFREQSGGGGRSYDYVSFSFNIYGLGVSCALISASSIGGVDHAGVSAVNNFVVPKRSELLSVKESVDSEIARSIAADDLHQKEITLLKNLVYDTVAASVSYSEDYAFWMDVPASIEVSGSYHEVLDDAGAQLEEIVGSSVVWNQLVTNGDFSDGNTGWTAAGCSLSVSDNVATLTFSAGDYGRIYQDVQIISGHKYLMVVSAKSDTASGLMVSGAVGWHFLTISDKWTALAEITTAASTETASLVFGLGSAAQDETVQLRRIAFIDLTQDFPTDTPASVDDPRIQATLFDLDLDHNAGSIKSSIVDKVTSHGFNLWDEEWEPGTLTNKGETVASTNNIRSKNFDDALPNTAYYFDYSKMIRVCWYDADHVFIDLNEAPIGGGEITSPAGTRCFKIATLLGGEPTYANNICVSKSNVSLNGQYKPWIAPMSVDLEAMGLTAAQRTIRSAGTVSEEIYAVMQPDETYQLRRTVKVSNKAYNTITFVSTADSGIYRAGLIAKAGGEVLSSMNYAVKTTFEAMYYADNSVYLDGGNIYIHDNAVADASALNSKLASHSFNYELAEPTDELLAEDLAFGDLELLIEKGGYLSIDNENERYGAVPGLTVDLPILRYE